MKTPIRATVLKTANAAIAAAAFALLEACSSPAPYATTTGELAAHATMTVATADATVEVYRPASGEPANRFTVAATAGKGSPPPPPVIRRAGNGIVITASNPLDRLLVRVPDGVNVVIAGGRGDISVTGITGNADVSASRGDVRIMVSGYAQAATGQGHLAVTIGASQWPGTLKFSDGRGDVEISVLETAKFHVRLHTVDGTLFTDFGLRGAANGKAETIDADVNGGGTQGIDVETRSGTIRLLRLAPQA